MINLFGAHINSLSIHRVGNKINNEPIFLSDDIYKVLFIASSSNFH